MRLGGDWSASARPRGRESTRPCSRSSKLPLESMSGEDGWLAMPPGPPRSRRNSTKPRPFNGRSMTRSGAEAGGRLVLDTSAYVVSEESRRHAALERIQPLLDHPSVHLGGPRPSRDELHER